MTDINDLLSRTGLRPTRQRLALMRLLFEHGSDRHVTAEQLHAEAVGIGEQVSVATVYNTLHELKRAGLLREPLRQGAAGHELHDDEDLIDQATDVMHGDDRHAGAQGGNRGQG